MAEKRKKTWFTVWVQVAKTSLDKKVLRDNPNSPTENAATHNVVA